MHPSATGEILRFGEFQLDRAAYELRRRGRPVKLARQSMDLLILLVESPGQLVSRSDIVNRLWGKDVFVDVETGVNTAISRIRQALRDAADAPKYLETVPGKGYRFIASVETGAAAARVISASLPAPAPVVPASVPAPSPVATATPLPLPVRPFLSTWRAGLAVALLVLVAAVAAVVYASFKDPGSVRIAVLPFENLGSDSERAYLAAGLTDETSASLAQIDPAHLIVKGRTLGYKGSTKSVAQIGQELAVDYLVQSSIRAEGPRLRVTVMLIRVKDQEHVWSQFYDREPSSVLGLEQELSSAIAGQIRLRLSSDRIGGLGRRQTGNPVAYDLFLKGEYQRRRRTAEGNARAAGLYQRALEIDANYALAWSSLAFTYTGGTINGDAPPAVVGPLWRAAAMRAVRANPALSEAQLVLGHGLWLIDWDWQGADAALRLAIDLDPSSSEAHRVLGHALSQSGRHAEAESMMRRARELDALDPLARALSSQVAFQRRDVPAALEHARQAIALDPNLWVGYMQLAQAYEGAGDHHLALESLADAERFANGNSKVPSLRGYVLAKSGRLDAAREVARTLANPPGGRYTPPYATALVYAGLGDTDAMFAALEQAYAARDVHLIYLPVDMKWEPYRSDPRFVALIARCGFTSSR